MRSARYCEPFRGGIKAGSSDSAAGKSELYESSLLFRHASVCLEPGYLKSLPPLFRLWGQLLGVFHLMNATELAIGGLCWSGGC